MRRIGCFFKSILAFIIVIIIQVVVAIVLEVAFALSAVATEGADIVSLLTTITELASDVSFGQLLNLVYGVVALLIFGIWYAAVFVGPARRAPRENRPRGFSFHTLIAMFFLGIGLQYVTILVVNITATLRPDWLVTYNQLMQDAGYSDLTLMLIVYSALLAPILEELIFRGVILRYAHAAMPFWFANIWQALLFGLVHGNFIQGIYAFVMGLFLGAICQRGRGIKYSIPVHIVFNIMGLFFSDLISVTIAYNAMIMLGGGVVLTIFSLWLFYTDFSPAYPEYDE